MPLLTVEDLVVTRSKREAPVLNGVSLKAEPREKIGILGPSGSGKTTLFRSIAGFVPLRSGRITVNGVSVAAQRGKSLRRLRRNIALVFQSHDLVDRLRVYQNVMAGALGRWSSWHALRFLIRPTAEELGEAARALDRVGIAHKLRARTSEISGGEHQRVAIARALVQEPMLLLADEPIASLDPALGHQILSLLCQLADENGFALLCSLHQQQFAYQYFDRVIRLEHGTIQREDCPQRARTESVRAGD